MASSLVCQSAAPAPASCSGSLRTGALPRRPHRSRRNQQLPAGKGHPVWHISVAQRTRNSMPRRECMVQDSLKSPPKSQSECPPPLCPTVWGSSACLLLGGWKRVASCGNEYVWGSSATVGCCCFDKCLVGTDLWTLRRSWILSKLELLILAQSYLKWISHRLGNEGEALPLVFGSSLLVTIAFLLPSG